MILYTLLAIFVALTVHFTLVLSPIASVFALLSVIVLIVKVADAVFK